MSELIIFTDGGSRGNPGAAAIGIFVCAKTDKGEEVIFKLGKPLGIATNNEAEYEAFYQSAKWLAEWLKTNAVPKIRWQLDSKLVVEQLNKNWKIKEERLRPKAMDIWAVLNTLTVPYSINHIPRALNHEADRLVNAALDANTEVA